MLTNFFGETNKNKFLKELLKILKNIFISKKSVGKSNGIAPLNDSGQISSDYLPSYVDDVIEYNTIQSFPAKGEGGKIYLALDTNISYRWGGSRYIDINEKKEDAQNKVTSLSSQSTDLQYPSAKCVYDIIGNVESQLSSI